MENPYRYSLTTRLKEGAVWDFLNPQAGEKILEVGCGLGYFLERVKARGAHTVGLDCDHPSLAFLSDKEMKGIQGSAVEIPFKDNTFDKVIFSDVIEHLEDDEKAMREISRVLRSGGELVLTTAASEGIFNGTRLNRLFHDEKGTPEYHVRDGYSYEELKTLFERHGLELKKARYSTVFVGEMILEMLKLIYYVTRKNKFSSQIDTMEVNQSFLFQVYKYLIFPFAFLISKVEEWLLSGFLKGHIVIVKAKSKKGEL